MRLKLDKEPGLPPIRSVIMTTDEIFMMVKTVYGYYTMLNLETGVLIEAEFTLVKELLQAVNQKYTIVRIIPNINTINATAFTGILSLKISNQTLLPQPIFTSFSLPRAFTRT